MQAAAPEITANAAAELVAEHSREKGAVEQAIFKSTIDLCKRTGALLDAKTNYDEGDGYKRFVIGIGRAVAGAAADAEYLGIGGGTISAYERRLLQAASDAMSLEEE
ncbi:MAG: hypothetical protein IPK16_13895 [Anaerolineales bacterium]|nr:hypothetical protein [Anaerolineales bacterium]